MDAFNVAIVIFAVYLSAVLCYASFALSRGHRAKFIVSHVMALYGVLLLAITLLPAGSGVKGLNLIPFAGMLVKTQDGYLFRVGAFFKYLSVSGLNVLLFLPFGAGLSCFLLKLGGGKRLLVCAFAALALSAAIEILQYVLPTGRVTDIDDVIFNTLGGFLGGVALLLAIKNEKVRKFVLNSYNG